MTPYDANHYVTLAAETKTKTTLAISLYNVLDAEINPSSLVITYAKQSAKDDVSVTALHYLVAEKEKSAVEAWMNKLLDLAYGMSQRRKRLKVLINPFGGKGNAGSLYQRYAAPIFAAARCQVDVQSTEYRGHAIEIAEKLDIDAYDAVVCCSGDGLPNSPGRPKWPASASGRCRLPRGASTTP